MKAADVDRIFKKLEMQTREGSDKLAWFQHQGKRVIFTRRSHGRGDIAGRVADFIRQQLKVSEVQFRGLRDCTVDKKAYIQILVDRGIIER